jgi:hypothetical protein
MRYIKIIHGSRNVFRPLEPQVAWMEQLAKALTSDDVEARTFRWSGLLHDAFRHMYADQFLQNLRNDLDALSEQGRSTDSNRISVIAKSLGTKIVERAFSIRESKGQNLRCDVFLRIAPPVASRSRFARTTINVSVPWDHLAFGAEIVERLVTHNRPNEGSGRVRNIRLSGLTHTQLNSNVVIPKGEFAGMNLYELYRRLLEGTI